jgi:DNA uptake protein ComE-like DNA-binding protein
VRKIILTAAAATTALALAACSQEPAADDTAPAEVAAEPAAPVVAEGTRLDANTARPEQLAAVEGLDPAVAEAVVAGRPYASVSALNAVLSKTLSEDAAEAVRTNLFVPVNLNTASEEDIALIPGMTDRMVHEFLEYRPYEDMAEFDREIGKYVDEAEVARLRSYVTL